MAADPAMTTVSSETRASAARRPALRLLSTPQNRFLKGALGVLALLAAWQASVPLIGLEPYLYPSPVDVWREFIVLVRKGILPAYVWDSLGRYTLGVSLGVALGVVFGLLIGMSTLLSRLFGPLISFLFAIVEAAWIPLFVVWWGYGIQAILAALIYVAFFPVLYNTIAGVRTVPAAMLNAARSLGAGRIALLREVIVPASLPNIITGIRVGAGFAFRGLIFAEMIAAKSGVGYLIFEGTASQQTARTIVGMLTVGLLWLFIDNVYVRPVERVTIERWRTVTTADERE